VALGEEISSVETAPPFQPWPPAVFVRYPGVLASTLTPAVHVTAVAIATAAHVAAVNVPVAQEDVPLTVYPA
jgi:hypothetical protein